MAKVGLFILYLPRKESHRGFHDHGAVKFLDRAFTERTYTI